MSLFLYDKPAQSDSFWTNLDHLATQWKRKKRAIGGYHVGSFRVVDQDITTLTNYYHTWLGNRVVERTFGIMSWEGIIWEMDLVKNGISYRRTLDPELWQNRINVYYTDRNGVQQKVGWSENTDSSGIYGEMEMIYTMGDLNTNGAQSLRDRALTQYAWPISRNVGGLTVGTPKSSGKNDGLYVTVAGFDATLNWQYYTSVQDAADADAVITALVAESEFVSAGRIETNGNSITTAGDNVPQRLGDMIKEVISQGDSSGNLWQGGVYANREFVYEQAPTTVDYIYRDGILYEKGGGIVTPELLDPGFYVRDANAPRGWQPPGSANVWDDPQVSYCDELEFEHPDTLRLSFPGQEEQAEVFFEAAREQEFRFMQPPPSWSPLYPGFETP